MAAEQFGARLLEEVQIESLDSLLRDLETFVEDAGQPVTGVQAIDVLLQATQHAPQPPREPPVRSYPVEPDVGVSFDYADEQEERPRLPARRIERASPVIEIASSQAGTGQTSLLFYVTSIAILPLSCGGLDSCVAWLDTTQSFSAERLHMVCSSHVTKQQSLPDPAVVEAVVKNALTHVHVIPVSSTKALLASLVNLKGYLLQTPESDSTDDNTCQPRHQSHHRRLSSIVIDSATAFYWPDRFDTELARLESPASHLAQPPGAIPSTSQLVKALKDVQELFRCTVLYTTSPHQSAAKPVSTRPDQATTPMPEPDSTPAPSPWSSYATLSLSLTRMPVPQFASHMSLDECLRDRPRRQGVVKQGRVRVDVTESWLQRVAKLTEPELRRRLAAVTMEREGASDATTTSAPETGAAAGAGAGTGFVMRIDGNGVEIET